MLRLLVLALAFTTAASPAAAQTATQAKPTAADFAKSMHGAVGQVLSGGMKVLDITAEANTLVLLVGGPDKWREGLSAEQVSTALVGGFCRKSADFFTTGVTMRVDSYDTGALLKGPLVNACPPAAAE